MAKIVAGGGVLDTSAIGLYQGHITNLESRTATTERPSGEVYELEGRFWSGTVSVPTCIGLACLAHLGDPNYSPPAKYTISGGTVNAYAVWRGGKLLYEAEGLKLEIRDNGGAPNLGVAPEWAVDAAGLLIGNDTIAGSRRNDRLFGFDGNDKLSGGIGRDFLDGGAGSDAALYTSSAVGVVVDLASGLGRGGEAAGDQLFNVENVVGSSFNDRLIGSAANNLLDGGTGADVLIGGAGNDQYVVDQRGDTVVEDADGGIDTVRTSLSYSLKRDFEVLVLLGTLNRNGTGNELDNRLIGNSGSNRLLGGAGDDVLDGGAGRDDLRGGEGDDSYVIDQIGDLDRTRLDPGIDTVRTALTYTLGGEQENLSLLGAADLTGTGNGLDNRLIGNTGRNLLSGAAGDDVLDGGVGRDELRGGAGNDTLITDGRDRIDGGAGVDLLQVAGAGVSIDFGQLLSIEAVDLSGTGINDLLVTAAGLLASTANGTPLEVRGDDDLVRSPDRWQLSGSLVVEGLQYKEYTSGGASIRIADATGFDYPGSPILGLVTLDGSNGFRMAGSAYTYSGGVVAGVGDVNGDGYSDMLIGAPLARPSPTYDVEAGESHVVFGRGTAFTPALPLYSLGADSGFRLVGASDYSRSGTSASGAGDVNHDGFDDFLIGAYELFFTSRPGYLVFGKGTGFGESLLLANFNGGAGLGLSAAAGDGGWRTVGAAGDMNGDGYDDLLLGGFDGSPLGSLSGSSFVVFGQSSAFYLQSFNGTGGLRVEGWAAGDRSGTMASAVGDVNGDGLDDLLLGAPGADFHGENTGSSFLVLGTRAGVDTTLHLSALDGTNGSRLDGVAAGDQSGRSVAKAGDVNGDGYDDVLVAAPGADPHGSASGSVFVVFGGETLSSSTIDLASLNGVDGFRLDGAAADDGAGKAIGAAGDVNGDGYDDLLIGAPGADPRGEYSGSVYLVFGRGAGFQPVLDLAALDGSNGFRIDGAAASDFAGSAVSAAGDINGDGFDDVLIGAPGVGEYGNGATYLVFGQDFSGVVARAGGSGNDSLIGTAGGESLVGGRGNDFLNGAGGADVLIGGAGNATLVWDRSDRNRDGGSGEDTLRINGNGVSLDLTLIADNRITGIERIDLTGNGNNSLTLEIRDVLALPDHFNMFLDTATRQLVVDGNSGDSLHSTSQDWVHGANVDLRGTSYASYTHASIAAQLLVDLDVTRDIS